MAKRKTFETCTRVAKALDPRSDPFFKENGYFPGKATESQENLAADGWELVGVVGYDGLIYEYYNREIL